MTPHSIERSLFALNLLTSWGIWQFEKTDLFVSEVACIQQELVDRGFLERLPSGFVLSPKGWRMLGTLCHALTTGAPCHCEPPSSERLPCDTDPCDCAGRCTQCGRRVGPSPEYL